MKLSAKAISAIVAVCCFLFFILVLGLMYVSATNTEVSLRNQYKAQLKSNESSFDKTWKVIQQQANVAETERDSFKKTYTEIMTATAGIAGNGSLASFLSQSKIDISPDLFQKLMTTIESQREGFHRDQQKLLQIIKQHDDIRTKIPSSLFVGGREPLETIIITSSKTSEVFETQKDDDLNLFNK